MGYSRYADGGSCCNAGPAISRGYTCRRFHIACSTPSDPILTEPFVFLYWLVWRVPGLLYAVLRLLFAHLTTPRGSRKQGDGARGAVPGFVSLWPALFF